MADLAVVARVRLIEDRGSDTLPAAAALGPGVVCRPDGTTGKATTASAAAAGTAGAIGLNLSHKATVTNQPVHLLRRGKVALYDANGANILDGLAYGAQVYLSNTAGRLADAAGTVSVVVGRVIPLWDQNRLTKVLDLDLQHEKGEFDPQEPPLTVGDVDDEFNGARSADWSWSVAPASESFAYRGWMLVGLSSPGTYELRRAFSPGSGAFGIEAMLSFPGYEDLDEVGLAVLDSSNARIADVRVGIRSDKPVFLSNLPGFDLVGSDVIVNGNIENALGSEWVTNNVARDNYAPYEGVYALRGANVAPTTTPYANYARQTVTIGQTGTYVLSCYVRRHPVDANGGSEGRVRVKLVDPDGQTAYESPVISSSAWTQIYEVIDVSKTGAWTFWFTPFSVATGIGWDASRGQCDQVKFYQKEFKPAPNLNRLWLRLHRDAQAVYRLWWSSDGVTWKGLHTSSAIATTVAKLALLFGQATNTEKAFGVNYIRRYA